MKLLFLFMRYGSNPNVDNWLDKETEAYPEFSGSCYFELIRELVDNENSNIYEATILIESAENYGVANWVNHPKVKCLVVPDIDLASEFVDSDTIIFARGGFKQWHEWLMRYKERNWLMLYAANTGMSRWPFWDIVLDDIKMEVKLDSDGRLTLPFIKPVNESDFFPKRKDNPIFDLCVGASHIHDKKGQWRARKVYYAYKSLYNEELKIAMPGSPRRSEQTLKMLFDDNYMRNIYYPGYVDKKKLNDIFANSKFFLHLGTHGQNDRGPLEALAAGVPLIIASPKYHTVLLDRINQFHIGTDIDNYDLIAKQIRYLLMNHRLNIKEHVYNYYKKYLSFKQSVINMMIITRGIERVGQPNAEAKNSIKSFFKYMS